MSGRRDTRARLKLPKVDDEWLHALQKSTFTYFWEQTNPDNGLIPDNTLAATPASILPIISTHFGLDADDTARAVREAAR